MLESDVAGEWCEVALGRDRGAVRYLATGSGEPVVLLHGLSGSVAWWRRNIAALAREFRVYAIDLIHQGTQSARFVLAEAAERVAEWMRIEGMPPARIVGHSMGGHIAAHLAARYPELISKLVLVNAAALFPRTGPRLAPLRLLRWLPTFPPTLAPILVRDALRAGPRTLWEASRDLLTSEMEAELRAIHAPTLIVWGEHDGILPVELAYELQAIIGDSKLCVLAGAGHNAMWEVPEDFNAVVLEFLLRQG